MSNFINTEDGYFSLTQTGTICIGVLIVLLIVLSAFLRKKPVEGEHEKKEKKGFSARQIVFCAAALALGFATSYIKVFSMPFGGSVTLCSMLFVVLIGCWYWPRGGTYVRLCLWFPEFAQDGGNYILSPMQACMDYIFAFAALGLSGFFYQKKNGLIKGYIVAILVRGLFHTIGGYLYWMDYMPDNFPKSLAAIYPIVYNYSYILAEAVITLIVISLPPVKKALARVRMMAQE
ncbi:MAG: energy-coupled thiamine transporter ThiT [Lachnospiraceae bacterium]